MLMYGTIFLVCACETNEGKSCKDSQHSYLNAQKIQPSFNILLPVGLPLKVSSIGSKHLSNLLSSILDIVFLILVHSCSMSRLVAGTY